MRGWINQIALAVFEGRLGCEIFKLCSIDFHMCNSNHKKLSCSTAETPSFFICSFQMLQKRKLILKFQLTTRSWDRACAINFQFTARLAVASKMLNTGRNVMHVGSRREKRGEVVDSLAQWKFIWFYYFSLILSLFFAASTRSMYEFLFPIFIE